MISTGIPVLDQRLGGGIPYGKSLIYYAQPGIDVEVFGMQAIHRNLESGRDVYYLISTSPPSGILQRFRELGWDPSGIKLIDGYSRLLGIDSDADYLIRDPERIESFSEVLSSILAEARQSLVVIESLSVLVDLCGDQGVMDLISSLGKLLVLNDNVLICNFTSWPYPPEFLERIKSIFNGVVNLSGIVKHVIIGQYFAVERVDWGEYLSTPTLFKILKPGGVKIYIPKLLVTGPFNAGKSSFVQAISTRAVSVDRLGTTVALDHGRLEYKGYVADIFGTPGQERFDPILELLGGEALGVFLVIDSTSPQEFPRAKQMLERAAATGLPLVVVANKQDLEGALPLEQIRAKLGLPQDVPIVPTVAIKKQGVFEAVEVLISKVLSPR